ncbi:DNA replication/checkpoint protein [Podospora didyma]|uniref:DNA replication regulator SLD2 n=1 Tax=Podospora didyma TaxID=330526 RepID=A0AAE0NNY5_9PEZI|nr:DNA replication/checkpoint protein [Podospora didyma]
MDDKDRASYERLSQDLRAELKKWENDWASARGGRKPGRDDIKQNADIQQKYKQYSKVRDILAGKIPIPRPQDNVFVAQQKHQQPRHKRKQSDAALPPPQTPSKRTKPTHTPRKTPIHGPSGDFSRTPSSVNKLLFSPATVLPSSIGPTPQKDGRVLGLFDFLARTPSKPATILPASATLVGATPSKRRQHHAEGQTTPRSSRVLPPVTTPLHNRDGNSQQQCSTPSSSSRRVSKLQFATPSFLRRTTAPLPPADENGEWAVAPLRLPRKPLARGLSSVVAGLRKIEEESLDEDLDALHEMEMAEDEMFAGPRPAMSVVAPQPPPMAALARVEGKEDIGSASKTVVDKVAAVLVEDSQTARHEKPILLGGFDDENLYDSDGAQQPQLGRDGQPLHVYKKKGQKRTTRRVNMRPTRAKRPTQPAEDDDDDDDEENSEDDIILEAQFDVSEALGDIDEGDGGLLRPPSDDSDPDGLYSNDDDGDFDELGDAKAKPRKKPAKAAAAAAKAKAKAKAKTALPKDGKVAGEEGLVKKAVRKVKATAHANFKRLKLRNNGAKGGPAHNSRFKRRR